MTGTDNALRLKSGVGLYWDIPPRYDEIIRPLIRDAGFVRVLTAKEPDPKTVREFAADGLWIGLCEPDDVITTHLTDLSASNVLRSWFTAAHLGSNCRILGNLRKMLTNMFLESIDASEGTITDQVYTHTPAWLRAMISVNLLLDGRRDFVGVRKMSIVTATAGLKLKPFERWPGSFLIPFWSGETQGYTVEFTGLDSRSQVQLLDPIVGTIEDVDVMESDEQFYLLVESSPSPKILLVTEPNPGPQILEASCKHGSNGSVVVEWLSEGTTNGTIFYGPKYSRVEESQMTVKNCTGCTIELPEEADAHAVRIVVERDGFMATWDS